MKYSNIVIAILGMFLISCTETPNIEKPNKNTSSSNSDAQVDKIESDQQSGPTANPSPFSHVPKPETCEDCHQRPENGLRAYPNQGPPSNFAENADYPGSRHYIGKECNECHGTPDEGSNIFTFRHSTENPNACLPCHYNEGQEEHLNDVDIVFSEFGNCASCHQNFNVDQTRNFDPINGDDD